MNFPNIFKDEVFRPTATLVIPGSVATTPFIAIAFHYYPVLKIFLEYNSVLFSLATLLIFVASGLLMENFGSCVERHFDNKLDVEEKYKEDYKDHKANWEKYWRVAFKHEPVGHRYLRTIVLRLKFELNLGVSLLPALVGFIGLKCLSLISGFALVVIIIIILVLIITLYCEAFDSVKLLSNIRKEILKGVKEPPIE